MSRTRKRRGGLAAFFGVLAEAAQEARRNRPAPLQKALKAESKGRGWKMPGTISTTGGISSLKGKGGGGGGMGSGREGRSVEEVWAVRGRSGSGAFDADLADDLADDFEDGDAGGDLPEAGGAE